MATWSELKDFIGQNLKVTKDDGNVLWLQFAFDDRREQVVIVSRAGNDQIGEWAQVESPIGEFGSVDLEAVLRKSSEILCGAVASNGDYVTLRHSVPLADVDAAEILIPINAIVASADAFEEEFGEESGEEGEEESDEEEVA